MDKHKQGEAFRAIEAEVKHARRCVRACQGIENPEAIGEALEALRMSVVSLGDILEGGEFALENIPNDLGIIRAALAKLGGGHEE